MARSKMTMQDTIDELREQVKYYRERNRINAQRILKLSAIPSRMLKNVREKIGDIAATKSLAGVIIPYYGQTVKEIEEN